MSNIRRRREFLKHAGVSAASLPFVLNLPSLGFANTIDTKQRVVIVFSPNGTIPDRFWPDTPGADFELKDILQPLARYRDRMLILDGLANKVRGDGDNHMRGMSCLLAGVELFPGNIQGGSHTPAGWASGISIDQEIRNFFQSRESTQTRFGSLEFGVVVPDRADPWTRMVYAGPNKPIAPISDPYQMFNKMYGQKKDRAALGSILDDLQSDFQSVRNMVSEADRRLVDEHQAFVREMELELKKPSEAQLACDPPELQLALKDTNENMPELSKMQIELLVNSLANDFARVETLQYTNSVGQAKMRWLGIDEGHHSLSHESDSNEQAKEKLTKINIWFCEQVATLVQRLEETPEPGGNGSLLDNTLVIWTNEMGKGNSHSLDHLPFVLIGGGLGFKTGRAIDFGGVPHNRLWLTLAQAIGHPMESFGNRDFCTDGTLPDLL